MTGLIWLIVFGTSLYSSFNLSLDPAYSFSDDFKYYKYVQYFTLFIFSLYILWLLYYIVRAFGLRHEIPHSSRFKVVWGLTLFVIVVTIISFVVLTILEMFKSTLIFVSFQVLFNFYTFMLSILFLPSWQKEKQSSYDIEREGMLEHGAIFDLE
jgi:hypothetical protein